MLERILLKAAISESSQIKEIHETRSVMLHSAKKRIFAYDHHPANNPGKKQARGEGGLGHGVSRGIEAKSIWKI